MRKLAIAYGSSRKAKTYRNDFITFEELSQKLSKTIYTDETAEEYKHLPKPSRDAIKDRGGFVAGTLRNGRRRIDDVVSRSMLTQDVDFADSSFLDTYEMFYPYKSMLYSTHSHTKEAPRYRIVTPLTRDVTPEEYVAVSRYIACELGIDYYDECSFLPNQMMYMPTTPSDGEYVFKELDGAVLNPDDILNAHPEWRDVSTLPMSKKEKEIKPKADKKQQNPKDKEGVVGAFCRAYGGITNVYQPLHQIKHVLASKHWKLKVSSDESSS